MYFNCTGLLTRLNLLNCLLQSHLIMFFIFTFVIPYHFAVKHKNGNGFFTPHDNGFFTPRPISSILCQQMQMPKLSPKPIKNSCLATHFTIKTLTNLFLYVFYTKLFNRENHKDIFLNRFVLIWRYINSTMTDKFAIPLVIGAEWVTASILPKPRHLNISFARNKAMAFLPHGFFTPLYPYFWNLQQFLSCLFIFCLMVLNYYSSILFSFFFHF